MYRPHYVNVRLVLITGVAFSLFLLSPQTPWVSTQETFPTPTYDPFAQPPLPPNPTELEMGRYLFWRHCMPCHGDQGQGLTDEFRVLWEDHQDCWERGCHGGKGMDGGFPIPTIVPAIVTADRLSQFNSEEELYGFLRATHPPQDPGFLENDEYQALAAYVFIMNDRLPDETMPTQRIFPTVNSSITSADPSDRKSPQQNEWWLVAGMGMPLLVIILVWALQRVKRSDKLNQ